MTLKRTPPRKSTRIIEKSEKSEISKLSDEKKLIEENTIRKRGRPPNSQKSTENKNTQELEFKKNKTRNDTKNTQDSIQKILTTSNNIFENLTDDCVNHEIVQDNLNYDLRKKKQPYSPIILTKHLINPKETIKKIKNWTKNTVHFRSVKDDISIITYSKTDYDSIIKNLKEINFEFYTFTNIANRTKKLVLKGLSNI